MLASSGLHHKCAYRCFNEHMLFDKHFMKELIKLLFMCCSRVILFALVHVKPWKKSWCLCNSEMHLLVPRNFFHFMVTSLWWSVTDFLLLECSILHWYEDKKLHADHFWGLPVASVNNCYLCFHWALLLCPLQNHSDISWNVWEN